VFECDKKAAGNDMINQIGKCYAAIASVMPTGFCKKIGKDKKPVKRICPSGYYGRNARGKCRKGCENGYSWGYLASKGRSV
jgi:hypothetical protein